MEVGEKILFGDYEWNVLDIQGGQNLIDNRIHNRTAFL